MQSLFVGDRNTVDSYLRSISDRYYVYILCRPDGTPFYVGKGMGRRALAHEAEARLAHPIGESNPFKCNVIRKIYRDGGAIRYVIDSTYDATEQMGCLEREATLIGRYRRLHEGGCLTNLAGGIGSASGAAPFSLERHATTLSGIPENNPERATLNRFLLAIGPVDSVPIKPIRQIARILPTTPHPNARRPTLRCAYALIATAAANALRIEPNVALPRSFSYEGVDAIIENGVSRDILKAEMASLVSHPDPKRESFVLSSTQVQLLVALVGEQTLAARGLL